jgi:hypothetical protein
MLTACGAGGHRHESEEEHIPDDEAARMDRMRNGACFTPALVSPKKHPQYSRAAWKGETEGWNRWREPARRLNRAIRCLQESQAGPGMVQGWAGDGPGMVGGWCRGILPTEGAVNQCVPVAGKTIVQPAKQYRHRARA